MKDFTAKVTITFPPIDWRNHDVDYTIEVPFTDDAWDFENIEIVSAYAWVANPISGQLHGIYINPLPERSYNEVLKWIEHAIHHKTTVGMHILQACEEALDAQTPERSYT